MSNAVPNLWALISAPTPITFLQNITWTLPHLCQRESLYPCKKAVRQMLPILSHLLQHQDSEVLSDTCQALSYLTEGCNECTGHVVDMGVLSRLVELMTSSELNVSTPSLCTVGNTATGTDHQTQAAIDAGILAVLPQLLLHPNSSLPKEAAGPLSNVATGPHPHLRQPIVCHTLPPLVGLMKTGDFKAQKEAVWMVANFAMGAPWTDPSIQLVHLGVLEPLVNLLTIPDTKLVIIIIDIISFLLQATEKLSEEESLCLLTEELGRLGRSKALQFHENHEVVLTTQSIIKNHFSEEKENGTISPSLDQGHGFLKLLA